MLTSNGYYRQIDGLAIGSPPAPMLANEWLSTFDNIIKRNASLYTRYIGDILCDIEKGLITQKLNEINLLHPALKFTVERENDGAIAFLDEAYSHR